jgi:hypothetical protein
MEAMTTERDWEVAEQAIWPDGPAHGHGSGVYAGHKARVQSEIATLRAALADEKERNGLYLATLDNMNATIAHLRAALGKARLELMQDVDPDAIIDVIDCALTP